MNNLIGNITTPVSFDLGLLNKEEAFAQLQQLPGIGPFSSELILLSGAGDADGYQSFTKFKKRLLKRLISLQVPFMLIFPIKKYLG